MTYYSNKNPSNNFFKQAKKILDEKYTVDAIDIDLKELSRSVPTDADQFYQRLGLLRHDRTHKLIPKLAPYQRKFWNWMTRYKYRMAVKSQKVGLSTSVLMEDLQQALLPPDNPLSTMGYETIIVAQNFKKATDHLKDIAKFLLSNNEFRHFYVQKPDKNMLGTERSGATSLVLRNPWRPLYPSIITATGSSPGALWSSKRVKKIHMSDVEATNLVDDTQIYDAAYSRLAITQGFFVIESPPRDRNGEMYNIYKKSKLKIADNDPHFEEKVAGQFKVIEIPYEQAIEAGVTEESFFIGEMDRLGPRFGMYYECEFANPYNVWYDESLFKYSDALQLGESPN